LDANKRNQVVLRKKNIKRGGQIWSYDRRSKRIVSAKGKCLDVSGHSRNRGALIIVWRCHNGNNQKWNIHNLSKKVLAKKHQNGFFFIKHHYKKVVFNHGRIAALKTNGVVVAKRNHHYIAAISSTRHWHHVTKLKPQDVCSKDGSKSKCGKPFWDELKTVDMFFDELKRRSLHSRASMRDINRNARLSAQLLLAHHNLLKRLIKIAPKNPNWLSQVKKFTRDWGKKLNINIYVKYKKD